MERDPDDMRFSRVVGRRRPAEPGTPPAPLAREAMTRMARYRTRMPKGVFVYANHDEANRDRERWIVDAIVEARRVG
jgi:hypothetical protein